MRTSSLRPTGEPVAGSKLKRPAVLLALLLASCGSAQKSGGVTGGAGGEEETGGTTGGSVGSGGSKADAASSSGGKSGGAGGADAATEPPPVDASGTPADLTAGDVGGAAPADAGGISGPNRPEVGQACASGGGYNFTIRSFPAQSGKFTAFFTASPGPAPTNSVIGLSDGMKYAHDNFAAIVRFAENGMLDVRNGTAYSSATPIKYANTDYHFRLVIDIPGKKYAAYVSFDKMPELTLGTDLAFRDTAGVVTKMDSWGVEAIGGHMTKVCGFATAP